MKRATGIPSRTIDQLRPALDSLLASGGTLSVVGDLSGNGFSTRDEQFVSALHGDHADLHVVDANELVEHLRMRHSASELALERKAIDITVRAQHDAISSIRPGVNEFEIQALIDYTFRRNGADRPSFSSIVGSGPNSTALHYTANDRFMKAGDVVVMDIGASYRGYAADVTRTVPVSGTFTPEQRAVYQVVRDAQHAAELVAKIGTTSAQMDDAANKVLSAGLAKLGIDRVRPPEGAFYLYADVGHLTRDSLAFCQKLLRETGIATAPGTLDDVRAGRGAHGADERRNLRWLPAGTEYLRAIVTELVK